MMSLGMIKMVSASKTKDLHPLHILSNELGTFCSKEYNQVLSESWKLSSQGNITAIIISINISCQEVCVIITASKLGRRSMLLKPTYSFSWMMPKLVESLGSVNCVVRLLWSTKYTRPLLVRRISQPSSSGPRSSSCSSSWDASLGKRNKPLFGNKVSAKYSHLLSFKSC